jgi:flagellar hook protein FlgE
MSIFDALTSAVALQAQSFALQNISGNIANSRTAGYKETDTAFQDLVSHASAGGVTASSVGSITDNNATPGTDATLLGFGTTFDATNLVTRGLSGTLTLSVGGGTEQAPSSSGCGKKY